MGKSKSNASILTPNEVRRIMLRYFYDRNLNGTSTRGKKGTAVKISDIKANLKSQQQLTQQEVQSNLTYLLSQGWVDEQEVQKQFKAKSGSFLPATTKFYQITAAGIDKIEGEGEFTMPKFKGIKIEATGQNIITLGDGNKINAEFSGLGKSLVELREAITKSDTSEAEKMNFVADIDTIQSQLAKPQPNKIIIRNAWEGVKAAATINSCSTIITKVGNFIANILS